MSEHDDLKENPKSSAPTRFNILALSGGGFRGLFAAHILQKLEERFNRAAAPSFDLFAGTSIGGIVACALAVGVGPKKICKEMQDRGEMIFGGVSIARRSGQFLRSLITAKHSDAPLRDAIKQILGPSANQKLSKLPVPLLIPCVSYSGAAPLLLRSAGLAGADASDVTLLEACLATSAAPTFFPAQIVNKEVVVDGGLIANAPDFVAITQWLRAKGTAQLGKVHVLSIGTAGESLQRGGTPRIRSGVIGWLIGHRLVELTLAAQEQLAVEEVATLLGNRFLRVDAKPNKEQQKFLALDRADKGAIDTLTQMANNSFTAATSGNASARFLGDMFAHRAPWAPALPSPPSAPPTAKVV